MNDDTQNTPLLQEARLWQDENWTAQVIKNDDDDGWAVAMFKAGASEPALVGPWTMGRDKKNPKPLDGNAFITLVKTASEFVRRSEQQLHAQLNQSVVVNGRGSRITVLLVASTVRTRWAATVAASLRRCGANKAPLRCSCWLCICSLEA